MPDQRVMRPLVDLAGAQQSLGELLSWPQAGEDDLDRFRRARRQPAGDVSDPDLLAHVEHEHFGCTPDHSGL